jgi:Domain of unknown function (DUF4118)
MAVHRAVRASGTALPYLIAFAAPLAAAGIMVSVRDHVANTSLALIMVAVVVVAVTPGRRLAAVIAGVSAGLWFDFFLTRPFESFTIDHRADQETTGLLILVAVIVGEIAARNRRHRGDTAAARWTTSEISSVTRLLAAGATPAEVVDEVAAELVPLLFLDGCRFDPTLTQVTAPYLDRTGTVQYNVFARDPSRDGFPGKDVLLPVESHGHVVGCFVLRGPSLGVPVGNERLVAAVALADLAGAALGSSGQWVVPAAEAVLRRSGN